MTELWLKFIHIAGLAIWVAGLLYLPAMLLSHRNVGDQQDFARIRMGSRMTYMGLVSPAAFLAIGTGTALLFVADALHPWMFLKLMAVGVLVIAHLQYGYVLSHLSDQMAHPPVLRLRLIAAAVMIAALAVLALVLAKPPIDPGFLPDWLTTPGLLDPPEIAPPIPHRTGLPLPQG
ncbi:MAG TPA: CopD family protein [Sphingomicrobium sp.]|nr:CopD family protein [Sphingomicrobium sp.]